jgi:hypothetical protein
MSHRLQIAKIIESDYFQFIWIEIPYGPKNLSTNATETVDTYFNCHINPPN